MSAVERFFKKLWTFLSDVWNTLWREVLNPILEPIFEILGVKEVRIVDVNLSTSRLLPDSVRKGVLTSLLLKKIKNDSPPLDIIIDQTDNGLTQMRNFYYIGNKTYKDNKLISVILTNSINNDRIKGIIENKENSKIVIISSVFNTPTTTEWVKYRLQEDYGYSLNNNSVTINNTLYTLQNAYYDVLANKDIAELVTYKTIAVTKTYNTVEVTISSYSATEDYKRTYIYNRLERTDNVTGIITNTILTVSDTVTIIPKGTVTPSKSETLTNTVSERAVDITYKHYIETFKPVAQYVVLYRIENTDKTEKYWIYDSTSSTEYPSLKGEAEGQANFDMLPCVCIRQTSIFVGDFLDNNPDRQEKFKQTKEVLATIGMDYETLKEQLVTNPDIMHIQNVFVMFGLSLADTDPIVSKALFISIKEMMKLNMSFYQDSPQPPDYTGSTDTTPVSQNYAAVGFKQFPLNIIFNWTARPIIIMQGTLKHEYEHAVEAYEIITHRYQLITHTYEEYFYDADNAYIQTCYDEVRIVTEIMDNTTGQLVSVTYEEMEKVYTDAYNGGCPMGTERVTLEIYSSYIFKFVFKHMISPNTYELLTLDELRAYSLVEHYDVEKGDFYNTGKKFDFKNVEEDRKNFLLPLSYYVVSRLSIVEQATLYPKALHLWVEGSYYHTLLWYQSPSFYQLIQTVVTVIMVIITIITLGTATPITLSVTALVTMAIAIGISLALRIIANNISDPLTKAILNASANIVLIVAGMYIAPAITSVMITFTAIDIINMALDIVNVIIDTNIKSINDDRTDMADRYNTKIQELEEIVASLTPNLTTWDITNLVLEDGTNMDNNAIGTSLSMDVVMYMCTQAQYNYDLLYSGLYDINISQFCSNKLRLGVL